MTASEYCWDYRKGDSVGYDYGNVSWAENNHLFSIFEVP